MAFGGDAIVLQLRQRFFRQQTCDYRFGGNAGQTGGDLFGQRVALSNKAADLRIFPGFPAEIGHVDRSALLEQSPTTTLELDQLAASFSASHMQFNPPPPERLTLFAAVFFID